jgi:hypothetical protein
MDGRALSGLMQASLGRTGFRVLLNMQKKDEEGKEKKRKKGGFYSD